MRTLSAAGMRRDRGERPRDRHGVARRRRTGVPSPRAGELSGGHRLRQEGVLYLANRRDDGEHYVSEILAIARDGSVSTFAVLAQLARDGDPGNDGVLGLATDRRGNVYAALVSPDAVAHGVWRITRDGSRRTRLAGSERMIFPNALAFDGARKPVRHG